MARTKSYSKKHERKPDPSGREDFLKKLFDELPDEAVGKAVKYGKKTPRDIIGRPTVMTRQVLQKLEIAFKAGATDREACGWAGIAVSTLHNFCNKFKAFSEQKEDWKDSVVLHARINVFEAVATAKSLPDSWDILKRKRSKEYLPGGLDQPNVNINLSGEAAKRLPKYQND